MPETPVVRLADERPSTQIDWAELVDLVRVVVDQIVASGWNPTVIVALSRGGFIPGNLIGLDLGVTDVIGIDVQKDSDGMRSIGKYAGLQRLHGERVLVIDDGVVSGNLLPVTADAVRRIGGDARTCALVSEGRCPPPDYLAETREDISTFPWKRS